MRRFIILINSIHYKKVAAFLLLIILHCQTSLSQTENNDLYKTFTTVTKGIVEEAFRYPAGKDFDLYG